MNDVFSRLNELLDSRYRVLSALGSGGMGAVYLAEQIEPVRRRVAIKVLRSEGDSGKVVARFEAERQALAVMDHPSIAKVFDAGVLADGRPYFVMELVAGPSLTHYCDERRLTVRERVHLFIDVCQAVQHAHQKGVIHRDLKPSNVLVSEAEGRALPRVIDFGIAKATGSGEFDGTQLTTDDTIIGTPAYMSPEQIDGSGDVDTRSDLYSLGVLLYEVLVGALPYDPPAYRGWAAVAATLHRDPPTPTRRLATLSDRREALARYRSTTPKALAHELGGDVGWIALRAMDKNRDRRYETAQGMVLDLERYLHHQPVRARRATSTYLLGKFVRRHRLAVAFGATLALGIVVFSAVTVIQAERIARARDEADARRGQAEQLIDFMLNDLRRKLEPLGKLEILDDVGAEATRYFSSIPADHYTDEDLASRSQSLYQIGSTRLDQGDYEAADSAFTESLRLAEALSRRSPDDTVRLFGLAQSHFYVGYASYLKGDLEPAEAQFQGYLDAAERLVSLAPENPSYRLEVGFAYGNLGSVREARGDLKGAAEAYLHTLEAKQALVDRDSTNVDWLGELAETYNKLAVVHRKMGLFEEAAEGHIEEIALKRRLLKMAPKHAYWRFRYALAVGFLGDVRLITGQPEEALRLYTEEAGALDTLVASDSTNAFWRRARALVYQKRAAASLSLGRNDDVMTLLRRGERELETLVRTDSTSYGWHSDLALVRTTQAEVLLAGSRLDAALERARSAIGLMADDSVTTSLAASRKAGAYAISGDVLDAQGRHAAAAADWEKALATIEPFSKGSDRNEVRPLRAHLLLSLDRLPQASVQLDTLAAAGYVDTRLQRLAVMKGLKK